jgi:hypothetical protein
MITQVWNDYTTPANAGSCDQLLGGKICTAIRGRNIVGFRGLDLLRREGGVEVELVTTTRFDVLDSAGQFGGTDNGAAAVPAAARQVLARLDYQSARYDLRDHVTQAAAS